MGFSGIAAGFLVPAVMFLSHHSQPAQIHHQPAAAPIVHLETQHVTIPGWYRVQSGDTLSSISARFYGHASRWPALWWTNRRWVHNPNALLVGTNLHLVRWHPHKGWILTRALRHIPKPPPPRPAPQSAPADPPASSPASPASPAPAGAADPPASPAPASAGAPGSFQACVIAAESGGNPRAVNPSSGAGGLYQFLPSTWAALGHSGLPENASVAEQNQAFQQEYDQSGTSAWGPYDGC